MTGDLPDRLREAVHALDPVPEEVMAAARSALAWRLPGAVLAEHADGAADSAAGVPVRDGGEGGDGARSLTFTAPGLTIELEIAGSGRLREIVGRLAPPVPARIRVRHLGLVPEQPAAEADQAGHFVLPNLPEGLVSIVVLPPGGTSVVTGWMRL